MLARRNLNACVFFYAQLGDLAAVEFYGHRQQGFVPAIRTPNVDYASAGFWRDRREVAWYVLSCSPASAQPSQTDKRHHYRCAPHRVPVRPDGAPLNTQADG